jgi:hypothetical protein
MRDIYIEDFSYILTDQKIPTNEIKKELEIKSGQKYRRINRYIILALAGIYNMPSVKEIDEKCALLVGTRNGCIMETITMLDQIHNNSLLPMPFTFISSSTNMVNFHIAQSLGLNGSNYTISNSYSPFIIALDTAYFDINDTKNNSALVGCVDEIAEPLDKFKERLDIDAQNIKEGSFWVKISTKKQGSKAILKKPKRYKSIEDAKKELKADRLVFIDDSTPLRDTDGASTFLCSKNTLQALRFLEEKRCDKVAIIGQIGDKEFLSLLIDSLR